MRICKASESMTIMIDSLICVLFDKPDFECNSRNILGWVNNEKTKSWKWVVKEEMEKL